MKFSGYTQAIGAGLLSAAFLFSGSADSFAGEPATDKTEVKVAVKEKKPIEVTLENYEAVLKKIKGPVLIDFHAPWCGPCRTMNPHLKEYAKEWKEGTVLKFNTDLFAGNRDPNHPLKKLADQISLAGIPALAVLKADKTLAGSSAGGRDKAGIKALVDDLLNPKPAPKPAEQTVPHLGF